jgi:hypothetical protein
MIRRRRDEIVEARADRILAGQHAAAEFAEHFDAQLRRTGASSRLSRLLARGRGGMNALVARFRQPGPRELRYP